MGIRQRNLSADCDEPRRKWLIGAGGIVVLVYLGLQVWARWPVPQLKSDEQVFNTVDALFTAVSARDAARLSECEQRLNTYHADGRISDAVANQLGGVVRQARDGDWESAAQVLYDFILGQQGAT